ncbi:MAG TPA: hypothetical protein GX398_04200 [Candidatus Cloacimonetes bacterium]|nr:hypothetical protein [Candidatus Cloacimonadota bacterium]
MFKLDEKHLEAAQKMAAAHRTKKSCDTCYDRGWVGVSEQNLLVLCTRCVDMEAAMADWKEYVSQHEELKEHFSDLFEEKEEVEQQEDTGSAMPTRNEHKKDHIKAKQTFIPGQKRTGRAKKI